MGLLAIQFQESPWPTNKFLIAFHKQYRKRKKGEGDWKVHQDESQNKD